VNSLKLIFGFIFVLLVIVSAWFHIVTNSLPISFTRSYTVYLKDKDTGQPIAGVIAECEWFSRLLSIHTSGKTFSRTYLMSDENGKIQIPPRIGIHLYSYFDGFWVKLIHPIYDTAGIGYSSGMPTRIDANGDKKIEWWDKPVEMRSLANKFKDSECNYVDNTAKSCTNNGEALFGNLTGAQHYYEIPFRGNGNRINRNLARQYWKEIAQSVYAKSKNKPWWVDGFDLES